MVEGNEKLIRNEAYFILNQFKDTEKNEEAFYIKFNMLSGLDIEYLMAFYSLVREWHVFQYICKFWSVKIK